MPASLEKRVENEQCVPENTKGEDRDSEEVATIFRVASKDLRYGLVPILYTRMSRQKRGPSTLKFMQELTIPCNNVPCSRIKSDG